MRLWIARDLDGSLYIYDKRPKLVSNSYFDSQGVSDNQMYVGDYTRFPEVTFENSPKMVELELL